MKKIALAIIVMAFLFISESANSQASLYAPAATAPGSGGCYTGIGINRSKPDFPLDIIGGGVRINQFNFDRDLRIKGSGTLSGSALWDGSNVTNCTTDFVIGGPGNVGGAGGSLGHYIFGVQRLSSLDSVHLCGDTASGASFTTAAAVYGFDIAGERAGSFQFYSNVLIDNAAHDGLVGIGTTSPSTQLHTTGGVRFAGLTSGGSTRTIVSDANGVLHYQTGTPTSMSCSTANYVPVVTGVNALGCSQIYDNGTSVGISTTTPRTYSNTGTYALVSGAPANGTVAKLDVNGLTFTNTLVVSSDARLKTSVKPITDALGKVAQLNGVTYLWNSKKFPERNFDNLIQAGFLAQDVEKVYPEAVMKDDKGYYAMNYNAIIPLLSEAIKELNAKTEQNAKLNDKIAALESRIDDLCNGGCAELKGSSYEKQGNQLMQNAPNPFSNSTVIGYAINKGNGGYLAVNALDGKLIRQIDLAKGQGSVTLAAGELSAGTYTYSLYVDGKAVETKLMVISSSK